MNLRARCEVLKAITDNKRVTSTQLRDLLPHMQPSQIYKAVYQLLTQDRVFKDGLVAREGSFGRPCYYYIANENWERGSSAAKIRKAKEPVVVNTEPKKGRKNHTAAIRTNGIKGSLNTAAFRDRKVRLLLKLVHNVYDTDRDLLIGILHDYGHTYRP